MEPINQEFKQLFIITGYSGAGKSTVLRSLEDLGFFCVDNLPIELLNTFFNYAFSETQNIKKIALGVDIRGGHNISQFVESINLANTHKLIKIVFLTASSSVLLKRFQETRRKHPLADPLDLADAIEHEKNILQPLAQIADFKVDTDQFNMHELRSFVRGSLAPEKKPIMMVSLTSFGFKYGVPQESNFVFDLRSLPNPYFLPALRKLDGTQQEIKQYLFSQPEVSEYWHKLRDFFLFSLEKSYQEGRFFMHIAIGCTGGRHRSVAFVQELASLQVDYVHFLVKHRDLIKDTLL
jgi:RNase adapter protein RapZ